MSVSKMVLDRSTFCQQLVTAFENYRGELTDEIHQLLSVHLQQNESFSKQELEMFFTLLTRLLSSSAEKMIHANEEHSRELGEDIVARRELDEAVDKAYNTLRDFKSAARNAYGVEFLEEIQIHGPTPRDYQLLSKQYGLLNNWLGQSTTNFPATRSSFTPSLKKADVLAAITPSMSLLEQKIAAYHKDKKETTDTMLLKNQEIQNYDRAETIISAVFIHLLSLAGKEEEASRVRPKRRQSKSSSDVEDSNSGANSAPQESTTEASNAQ